METNISPAELQKCLQLVQLLDVREPFEYATSHLENSIHIPLGDLPKRALAELNPQSEIIVYCAHGVRSLTGLKILQNLGFSKVKSLTGGIVAWQEWISTPSS